MDFYAQQSGNNSDTLRVRFTSTGDPRDEPTSDALAQVDVPESTLTASYGWNTATFASPIRNLSLNRNYAVVWSLGSGVIACKLAYNTSTSTNVLDSSDSGASWEYDSTSQTFGRIYGTYTTPGSSYNLTRNYVSSARLAHAVGQSKPRSNRCQHPTFEFARAFGQLLADRF